MNWSLADVLHDLAPTGAVRAAINLGNPVLAQGTADDPRGVTVDVARELSRRLGVPVRFLVFDAAGKVFEALKSGAWDVAFLAIEPVRAAEIAFTSPYVVIEGVYAVAHDSPLATIADVDRPGVRIAVNSGSAYDLYLTRTLKGASIVRAGDAAAAFERDRLEVLAGVRQPVEAYVASRPGLRLIAGRFMEIRQAMGTPKDRRTGVRYLSAFIDELKASGFIAAALKRSGQSETLVAPES